MKKSVSSILEREKNIIVYITKKQKVTIDDLCQDFQISPSTARLIVGKLAKEGKALRTLGGAEALPQSYLESERANIYNSRSNISNFNEKSSIAVEAVKLVAEGDVLAICGGTTTYLFAKELVKINNIVVVTNSIWVANELCVNPTIDVRVSGGNLHHKKGSLTGPITERYFDNLRFDKMFIGVDSIDLECGVTNNDSSISFLERNILSKTKFAYLLADYTKFVKTSSYIECIASFQEITALITDSTTDKSIVKIIQEQGTKVYVAE